MSPETGPKTFLKAQIAVSEVLGWQRFYTAVFYAIVACTKRELKAASPKRAEHRFGGKNSFQTSNKISFWRQRGISVDKQVVKSFSYWIVKILTKKFHQHAKSFLSKSWPKKIHQHVKSFSAKQHSKCDSFSQKSRDFACFCDSVTKFGQGVTQAFLMWSM